MYRKLLMIWTLIVTALFNPFLMPGHASSDPFPQYDVIAPNVSFWIKVYSHYPTTKAIVHDSLDLNIIYDVIELKPNDQPGARKINRKRMKQVIADYRKILSQLAADPGAGGEHCRRVAELFGIHANARTFSRARHRIRCQIGQQDRFRAGLIRSGAYIDQMRAILIANGVPEDLAYLPHVESSFNTNAYSKFGAAGMWQFTRSTGKRFMTVDYVLDERRDPIAATHAAARLLKENYNKLGNWPLAITAYNHGAAGMKRAKGFHGNYPEIFKSYNGRTFKFASRNFYSEFLAARQVASNYHHYFGDLPFCQPDRSRSVALDGYARFEDLCNHFNEPEKVIRALNPALRPPVFSGQKYVPKGYRLNLPPSNELNGQLLAAFPSHLYKTAQQRSRFYTVRQGDTAGKIARVHQVKLNDLILANNLDRRATIYTRQTLRIPQPGESAKLPSNQSATIAKAPTVHLATVDNVDATPTAHSIAPLDFPIESATARYRRPGPAPADLLAMMDMATEKIMTQPTIQESRGVNTEVVTADVGFNRIVQLRKLPVGIIRVEVEETLGHYAEWAGIRASQIRRLNNLSYGMPLHLHQKIKIPLSAATAPEFEARRYEFHKRLQEDFFSAYRIGELQRYRVKPGDSYWTLCREKFDLPLWLLRHYNEGVNLAVLKIHQPLTIPAIEKSLQGDLDADDGKILPDA